MAAAPLPEEFANIGHVAAAGDVLFGWYSAPLFPWLAIALGLTTSQVWQRPVSAMMIAITAATRMLTSSRNHDWPPYIALTAWSSNAQTIRTSSGVQIATTPRSQTGAVSTSV